MKTKLLRGNPTFIHSTSLTVVMLFSFLLLSTLSFSQTFTTVQDGDWSSRSTWDANGRPSTDLSNDIVNINHRVEMSGTIKLQGNSTLNVNDILILTGGSIELENTNDTLNIDFGLLSIINGSVLNKEGIVNFNYGRMQLCNDGYKDESSGPQGTFGIGSIFALNGNIEDSNSGYYSSGIEWCAAAGDGVDLPISENCSLVNPSGSLCNDEFTYLAIICKLGIDTDKDGVSDTCDLDDDNDGISDLVELNGNASRDTDTDGLIDSIDIDADNDGIPDNVEAQLTIGYIAPTGAVNSTTGILDVYGDGLTPVDTDLDGIADIIDSDSDADGKLDIRENGMANALSGNDTDNDGLDNIFETSGTNDSSWDVNEDISAPTDLSILPDTDGDLFSGGDLDYRDLFDVNPPSSATLDFDGIDDYLTTPSFIDGLDQVTIMAWINSDLSNLGSNAKMTIAGEDKGCRLYVRNNRIYFSIQTQGNAVKNVLGPNITNDQWHHMTGTYSSTTGIIKIYLDGKLANTKDTGTTGDAIATGVLHNGNFEIGRISKNTTNKEYFKGEIDEVRVFDLELTDDQIQRMVYQEIEENSGKVRGVVIPKDIVDISTGNTVSWNNLLAYYPMTDIKNSTTSDNSGNAKTLRLKNITTFQEQTAPMPYVADNNGDWTQENTWLHGDVWDIEQINSNKSWSIIDIQANVEISGSTSSLGLLIDSNKTLTVEGDNMVSNSWFLELNGTLDLKNDSQLIQTIDSDLVTSATGKILRRQEGASSYYWYNYWSSPVGLPAATTLSDNNAAINNANNSPFRLNMLKDGLGNAMEFTNDYHETGKLSTDWFYSFENGVTYYDWSSLTPNTSINPGVGYIHKGTGVGLEQQYTFEGKPNNGTIKIAVSDVGGLGSEAAVSKTEYLLGNPYPSALDITKFIIDNQGVIGGSIQLWQQWAGDSHNTTEYDGGYAVVNMLGSVRAYQFIGGSGTHNGSQDGTKAPSKYLSIGQSFITEIVSDGEVEFNNSQRIFKKETDYNGGFDSGSIFFRETEESQEASIMQKIRLEFNAIDGQATRRELLLGFSDITTDDYDYGYEALNTDDNHDDLNLLLNQENMTMQAYGSITTDKVIPLGLKTSGNHSYSIKLVETEEIDSDQEIYLRDNLTGTYFDLRQDTAYTFVSEYGIFNERFEIVFEEEQSLSTEDFTTDETLIYYSNNSDMLYVKGLDLDVSKLALINMLGQTVHTKTNVSSSTLENGLPINKLATGIYIVSLKTQENQTLNKKIVIE